MMADTTAIEWTDATINFWWGCTKVGPGCDHCYAETLSNRFGGGHWGTGSPRRKIKGAVKLLHWLDNNYAWWAADLVMGAGQPYRRRRVFIQSMSDLFDNEVPLEWFAEAWQTICACDRIEVQIVTKRLPMVEKRLAEVGGTWPSHAGLIATVCTQTEADRDVPRLLDLKARLGIPWVGLSVEPMLGPIDLHSALCRETGNCPNCPACLVGQIDWIICGGESGKAARPMHPDWARDLRNQCVAAGVPFFFKQWGEWVSAYQIAGASGIAADTTGTGHCPKPHRYRILGGAFDRRSFESLPQQHDILRLGKRRAGRILDGREWNQMIGGVDD